MQNSTCARRGYKAEEEGAQFKGGASCSARTNLCTCMDALEALPYNDGLTKRKDLKEKIYVFLFIIISRLISTNSSTCLLVYSFTKQFNFPAKRYFTISYLELLFFFFKQTTPVILANNIITCNMYLALQHKQH